MGQVLALEELIRSLEPRRGKDKIVFTNGCFDLLHVGHIRYLKEARALGNVLVVGVNKDSSVKKLKGLERPLQHEQDRAEILSSLEAVDYVTLFAEDTPRALIEKLKPDILVKGGDWPADKIEGAASVLARGGRVESLRFVQGRSTTGLVEKIKKL